MEPTVVLRELDFGEGPRWHEGRLWFSDFFRHGVFTLDGDREDLVVEVPGQPSGLGWLPDGRLLVVSMLDRRLLVWDGAHLQEYADLTAVSEHECNDLVVGPDGTAYVSTFGFDLHGGAEPRPTRMVIVSPDGEVRVASDEVWFPNGSVITPEGRLIVGETFASRYTSYALDATGMPVDRRVWAEVKGLTPDGCCLDAEGRIWSADPVARRVVLIEEGGRVLHEIPTEQSAVACMLGGPDRRTLFILTSKGTKPERVAGAGTGRIETVRVEVPGAGLP
jgi:sugar lactone lactonase YvrE